MEIKAQIVKAFTKDKNQGNPAGVVHYADVLTDEQMQHIAKELGFSETVFLQRSSVADVRCRFFTPLKEIDLCSHATIAGFFVYSKRSSFKGYTITYNQETRAGTFLIRCHPDGFIETDQNEPTFLGDGFCKYELASLLRIDHKNIGFTPAAIFSTGTPKMIVPIDTLDTLMSINPDLDAIKELCRNTGARGLYVYTNEKINPQSDFHTRQFNPLIGIDEDPVTGVAAGALVGYIKHYNLSDHSRFIVEQGAIMNKLGRIFVRVVKDKIKVGGYAVKCSEQIFTFPQ